MKIITLSKLKKTLKPNTVTLVGTDFDLFNIEQLKFLRKCSKVGRPLVVIVQADATAKIRLGYNRPIINEKQRAEIVATLEFVDYVLILPRPSDYEEYLKIIKPKKYIYPKGIIKHRKYTAGLIMDKFPNTKIFFLDHGMYNFNADYLVQQILARRNYSKIKNPIIRQLYYTADNSKAIIGKISALIVVNNKIIAKSDNNESKDIHAEYTVIDIAKSKGVDLEKAKLYILIPPCSHCAKYIIKNKISKVYYLHSYGNDDGIKLLNKNGIKVGRVKV